MTTDRVMLLIDADNVSVDIIEQAVELLLDEYGALHVRRAYCTAESALKHQQLFKRLSIKPMVNLAAGKNSTDIALAVDAVDLVLSERPEVVVIASSDSDFAPLVSRLREKGCKVRGIGQEGKTGEETLAVYDDYTVLEHRKRGGTTRSASRTPARGGESRRGGRGRDSGRESTREAAREAARETARETTRDSAREPAARERDREREREVEPPRAPARAPVAEPEAAPAPPPKPPARSAARPAAAAAEKAPAKTPARKSSRRKVAQAVVDILLDVPDPAPVATPLLPAPPPPAPAAPLPDAIVSILAALPELARGGTVELRVAAERLRDADLLGPRGSSTRFFAPYAEYFELVPEQGPNKVRRRTPTGG